MKLKLIASAAILSTVMSMAVANADAVSKEILQKRAAFALGVEARQVNIEKIEYDGLRVEFIANVNNKKIPCYVTSGSGVVSDALCSGQSNALLDAAKGRGY